MSSKPLSTMKMSKPMRLESYTLRIDMAARDERHTLRGVIEHPSSELPIAFNGLFELWHAIHHFDEAPNPNSKQRSG